MMMSYKLPTKALNFVEVKFWLSRTIKNMLSDLGFLKIGWYHAIDLAESFKMVYLSS